MQADMIWRVRMEVAAALIVVYDSGEHIGICICTNGLAYLRLRRAVVNIDREVRRTFHPAEFVSVLTCAIRTCLGGSRLG